MPRTIFLKNPEDLIPAKIDGSGDSEKFYLKRKGGKAKGKRQNVGLSMGGGLSYYMKVFLEIPHDAA